MKWKLDRKYTTIAVYALLVIAFAIVLGMVFLNLSSIIRILGIIWEKSLSVLFGIFFTFCFLPVVKLFEKLFGKLLNRSRIRPWFLFSPPFWWMSSFSEFSLSRS